MKIPQHIPRPSKYHQITPERKAQIVEIYANNHNGETIKNFRQVLSDDYGLSHSTSWITDVLEDAGLYKRKHYAL